MDRELVALAQHGDRDAFGLLANAHADRLFAIALRIVGDYGRAEDVVQEALVVAWRELPTLRDTDRFESWTRQVLVRLCYAESSRARRWQVRLRPLPVDGPGRPDETIPVAQRDQIERGFRRLSAEQRAILVLHHYVGLEPTELAETLGIPSGTVRSRLHYAHRAMRAALDADERRVAPGGVEA